VCRPSFYVEAGPALALGRPKLLPKLDSLFAEQDGESVLPFYLLDVN
jgi:hypothetical protein